MVQRQQPDVAQGERDAAFSDALGEPLGDGCLTDASRPDERRVVLSVPEEDVDDPIDLGVAAADGLEPAGPGVGSQIAGEALERVTFGRQKITNHEGRVWGNVLSAVILRSEATKDLLDLE